MYTRKPCIGMRMSISIIITCRIGMPIQHRYAYRHECACTRCICREDYHCVCMYTCYSIVCNTLNNVILFK